MKDVTAGTVHINDAAGSTIASLAGDCGSARFSAAAKGPSTTTSAEVSATSLT